MKSEMLGFRLDADKAERIRQAAAAAGVSVTEYIVQSVVARLDQEGNSPPPPGPPAAAPPTPRGEPAVKRFGEHVIQPGGPDPNVEDGGFMG